ncbi:membrane dipeptidase [Lysinibacillus yapensis]|uniref:Membrane dipeptidase n=1 Tax=Ureibacillus yapensis TaxID=2304605 RepID=A0A396S7D5_9BACL|nr:membrane dipeptidase [Lysinibacillus yapensis]RHW33280.1 membrane dipeptidase [Lysinibacillus yapensis]
MKIIDLHCDCLEKLTRFEDADFRDDVRLQASLSNLRAGNVKLQVFAIFVHSDITQHEKFLSAARQIEAFHTKVLNEPDMVHITDWTQLNELEEGQIGAVLSLEGCDCIGNDLFKLEQILNAGVKLVGLTWNHENEVAYGASEDPSKGLKPFAKDVIALLNERDVIIDVSHLNEQGFYELLPLANHLIASHSNARALCDHPRNLTDEQVKALVKQGGRMHVVFYPPFVDKEKEHTTIDSLVKHVEYLASLVGIQNIGFGSDFDGMDPLSIENLSTAAEYENFIKALLKVFTYEEVLMMAHKGFEHYIQRMAKRKR